MHRFLSVLTLSLLIAAPAAASQWTVVPGKTRLGFIGTNSGKEFKGEFRTFSAKINFDPAAPGDGKAVVEIDTGSIKTTFPEDYDRDSGGKDWFYIKSYPKARFETTSFSKTGPNSYEAKAKLTIRGVTKNVTLPFTLDISGDTAHMTGELKLDRTEYGVGQGSTSKWFGAGVKVVVDLTAKRAG